MLHKLWSECGCPSSGVMFELKKNSKYRYKYEVRMLKRQQQYIKSEMMGRALAQSRSRDFWKEVRKMSKSVKGRKATAPVINNQSTDDEISNLFSTQLKGVLNSAINPVNRSKLLTIVSDSLCSSDLASVSVTPSIVLEASSHLKRGKLDGTSLSSNHFICTSEVLCEPLSKLFTAILRHGHIPSCLRDCILQPIPKPGKDPSVSDNYRPIALAPILSKIFEWCLLIVYRPAFTTSPLQFGFKPGLSTELCTGLIKNVTARYCINDSPVFGCFLDASKAFDRVDHHLLFEKLLQRNLPPVVVRALLAWYLQQKISVRWNKSSSDKFSISNGVRQGGVLSPILFTVYLDDLLLELERAGVGCYWRHHFVGAVCYADDIALLAPSLSALRIMLETCTRYASLHSLIFNISKTQLIKFSLSSAFSVDSPLNFCFLGQRLCFSQTIVHLGHILSHDLSDGEDIVSIKKDLCRKANCLLHIFSSCNPHIKSTLFQSFCLSLYGSALWNVSSPELQHLEVACNNILRKIWSLPRRCHTSILHLVASIQSIYNSTIIRSNRLIVAAINSSSRVLADVFCESSSLIYTSCGYNCLYGPRHTKSYNEAESLCASFIRDVRMSPALNTALLGEINHMCTV